MNGYDGDKRIREQLIASSSGVRDWYQVRCADCNPVAVRYPADRTSPVRRAVVCRAVSSRICIGIDWLHDHVKEHARLRAFRHRRGLSGYIRNTGDRLQGWFLVVLIALCTALIAGLIVTAESWLFDIKFGYCRPNWRLAKRFCCPPSTESKLAFPATALIHAWKAPSEDCADFVPWSEVLEGTTIDSWRIDYLVAIFLAIIFAAISSAMTVYLTSSETVFSAKDSSTVHAPHPNQSIPPPALSRVQSRRSTRSYGTLHSRQSTSDLKASLDTHLLPSTTAKRVMYFAAGSGIPEVKAILSGFVIRGAASP
jgi:chloride channel 3/4/5